MLMHTYIGPRKDGKYLVGYPTPGCEIFTAVCECRDEIQAMVEAERLNFSQLIQEEMIRIDQRLRGISGVYPALDAAGRS